MIRFNSLKTTNVERGILNFKDPFLYIVSVRNFVIFHGIYLSICSFIETCVLLDPPCFLNNQLIPCIQVSSVSTRKMFCALLILAPPIPSSSYFIQETLPSSPSSTVHASRFIIIFVILTTLRNGGINSIPSVAVR